MHIAATFGTTEEEIKARKWNAYLGVSVKNRAFTRQALEAFVRWGLDHSKDRFAILVVDILQRINNQVFERAPLMKALEKAFRQSDAVLGHCRDILAGLPGDLRGKAVLLEWPDIVDETYAHNVRCVFEHFEGCEAFRDYILDSVTKNLGGIADRLRPEEARELCKYILYELPEFVHGFAHGGLHYNLCVYPGPIAHLTSDLVGRDFYAPLAEKMRPLGPMAHAEAYPEDAA